MARSTPTAQQPTLTGLNPSFTAPNADGDAVAPGRVLLWVRNDNASQMTVTIETPATVSGLAVTDAGGAVPAGTERVYGPFPASLFARPASEATDPGLVWINYTSVTDVTRALIAV